MVNPHTCVACSTQPGNHGCKREPRFSSTSRLWPLSTPLQPSSRQTSWLKLNDQIITADRSFASSLGFEGGGGILQHSIPSIGLHHSGRGPTLSAAAASGRSLPPRCPVQAASPHRLLPPPLHLWQAPVTEPGCQAGLVPEPHLPQVQWGEDPLELWLGPEQRWPRCEVSSATLQPGTGLFRPQYETRSRCFPAL